MSRRMREMGFTRGIIRRGFRSTDQSIPTLSAADIARLMADPITNGDPDNLPGNAKKTKYAWLLEGETVESKKPRKKRASKVQPNDAAETVPNDTVAQEDEQIPEQAQEVLDDRIDDELVESQYPDPIGQGMPEPLPHLPHDGYVPSYISPYRQVNGHGGMLMGSLGERPPHGLGNGTVSNVGRGPRA